MRLVGSFSAPGRRGSTLNGFQSYKKGKAMDFSASTFWWVAAGVLVVAELTTGTFYLLMVAFGLAMGAIAAHLGAGPAAQIAAAAILGGGATAVWHWSRFNDPQSAPAAENKDVNLDVGEQVSVAGWTSDGTALVNYRGTQWRVRLAAGAPARPGPHRIAAVEGNALILAPLDRT
jgi:membrane protein implicated in regulation of membrane protease activity